MCSADVDRTGVDVLVLLYRLAGSGALLLISFRVVELGRLCPDCGGEVFQV